MTFERIKAFSQNFSLLGKSSLLGTVSSPPFPNLFHLLDQAWWALPLTVTTILILQKGYPEVIIHVLGWNQLPGFSSKLYKYKGSEPKNKDEEDSRTGQKKHKLSQISSGLMEKHNVKDRSDLLALLWPHTQIGLKIYRPTIYWNYLRATISWQTMVKLHQSHKFKGVKSYFHPIYQCPYGRHEPTRSFYPEGWPFLRIFFVNSLMGLNFHPVLIAKPRHWIIVKCRDLRGLHSGRPIKKKTRRKGGFTSRASFSRQKNLCSKCQQKWYAHYLLGLAIRLSGYHWFFKDDFKVGSFSCCLQKPANSRYFEKIPKS